MKKTAIYKYLGENGILESPILLPGVYNVKNYILEADKDKILTDGVRQSFSIKVSESELNNWYEIPIGQE